MAETTPPNANARFGMYEVDLRAGELRRKNRPVRLQEQPFQILAMLLAHAGEIVTREELKQKLWPADTFVDFDHSLNTAINKLREALGDSADNPRFVETLPRRGYRFIYPVGLQGQAALSTAPSPEPAPFFPAGAPGWGRIARWGSPLTLLVFLALAVGLNLAGVRDRLLGRPVAGEITSIAVLPLENLSGDPEQEYFVDGMTEALITELGKISALRVISRTSVMTFKGARKPLPEIARQLGVEAVVEGAVVRDGDRVRISAKLIHASKERTVWAESYERDLSKISTLQSEIARAVAGEIRVKLMPEEQARLARARPVNPRAYEAYLKGRYLQTKRTAEDMRKALAYFQHALEIDPGYVSAYVGIMDCYAMGGGRYLGLSPEEGVAKTKEAAQKAVALDETTAAAHYALATVKLDEWDFPGAGKEFERALELNPGDTQVRQAYSQYLSGMGRHGESIRESQRALSLDPLSPLLTAGLAMSYYDAGEYDLAMEQCRKALEMEADLDLARYFLAWSYWRKGLIEEALEFEWPFPKRPEIARRAREVYERVGVRAMIRWLVNDAKQRKGGGEPVGLVGSYGIARLYVELDDKEQAFAWLEKAYQEHDPWLWPVRGDPDFDPLRSDPRFQSLLRRMNVPK